jgi:endonuclease/exonuclease/phosphatase family metal-dependent hydrolase
VERTSVFRVATFNLRNGRAWDRCNSWPFRRRASVRALQALEADLIGLQEAFRFQLRSIVRGLPGYDAVGNGRDGGGRGEHVPVLVRRGRVRVVEHRTRWFGAEPDRPGTRLAGARFPRVATTVLAEFETGKRLQFTNTHLDERSAERRRHSGRQLVAWLDLARPQVLVGDFNAGPDDPMFRELEAAGFRHALPADAGGTFHRFTGRRDGVRIDHILVNDRVEVIAARVVYSDAGERLASDHWPVMADLALR